MKNENNGKSMIISRNSSFNELLLKMKNENKIFIKKVPKALFKESQSLLSVKRRFLSNMTILGHFKKVPLYRQKYPEISLSDHVRSIMFLSRNIMSIKGQKWIIKLYLRSFKKASYLKRSLKNISNKFGAFKS